MKKGVDLQRGQSSRCLSSSQPLLQHTLFRRSLPQWRVGYYWGFGAVRGGRETGTG